MFANIKDISWDFQENYFSMHFYRKLVEFLKSRNKLKPVKSYQNEIMYSSQKESAKAGLKSFGNFDCLSVENQTETCESRLPLDSVYQNFLNYICLKLTAFSWNQNFKI